MSTMQKFNQNLVISKAAQALPQNATATLFTVTGGQIQVRALIGRVTTALGATATTLSLGNTPTGGANVPASLCTAGTVTSLVLGKLFAVAPFTSGITPVAPFIGSAIQMPDPQLPIVVPDGVITWTTNANDTGQMSWMLVYSQLDIGATVS